MESDVGEEATRVGNAGFTGCEKAATHSKGIAAGMCD